MEKWIEMIDNTIYVLVFLSELTETEKDDKIVAKLRYLRSLLKPVMGAEPGSDDPAGSLNAEQRAEVEALATQIKAETA